MVLHFFQKTFNGIQPSPGNTSGRVWQLFNHLIPLRQIDLPRKCRRPTVLYECVFGDGLSHVWIQVWLIF